jgi:uncharacterized protein
MQRRQALQALAAAGLALPRGWATAGTGAGSGVERLATAWRRDGRDCAVVLSLDWAAARLVVQTECPLPGRAHGLMPLPDGGFVVLANRPGRWLLRLDADGAVVARLAWPERPSDRSLNGHALLAGDGTFFSTETDPRSGRGWIARRALATFEAVDVFESHGPDPHQLLDAADGSLVVANGGIARDGEGRKLGDQPLQASVALLDSSSGRLQGQWTLADRELSPRHLAWSHDGQRLGVALQAEHHDTRARRAAPLLAVLHGRSLTLPDTASSALNDGYAGDIAAAPGGGFVLSAQRSGRCLWWRPAAPGELTVVAELQQPCALLPTPDGEGVALSAGRGVARWHRHDAPQLLAWPLALAPDNHWVRLAAG